MALSRLVTLVPTPLWTVDINYVMILFIRTQENVAACLATTAIGGIWVSAAADFGSEGVLER